MKKTPFALAALFAVGCQCASPRLIGDWKLAETSPKGKGLVHIDANGAFFMQVAKSDGSISAIGGYWKCDKKDHAVLTFEGGRDVLMLDEKQHLTTGKNSMKAAVMLVGENQIMLNVENVDPLLLVRQQAENKQGESAVGSEAQEASSPK